MSIFFFAWSEIFFVLLIYDSSSQSVAGKESIQDICSKGVHAIMVSFLSCLY